MNSNIESLFQKLVATETVTVHVTMPSPLGQLLPLVISAANVIDDLVATLKLTKEEALPKAVQLLKRAETMPAVSKDQLNALADVVTQLEAWNPNEPINEARHIYSDKRKRLAQHCKWKAQEFWAMPEFAEYRVTCMAEKIIRHAIDHDQSLINELSGKVPAFAEQLKQSTFMTADEARTALRVVIEAIRDVAPEGAKRHGRPNKTKKCSITPTK